MLIKFHANSFIGLVVLLLSAISTRTPTFTQLRTQKKTITHSKAKHYPRFVYVNQVISLYNDQLHTLLTLYEYNYSPPFLLSPGHLHAAVQQFSAAGAAAASAVLCAAAALLCVQL